MMPHHRSVTAPLSMQVPCQGGTPGPDAPTSSAGGSGLTFDVLSDSYTYAWKTERAWVGTCRQLVVKLVDGTSNAATFIIPK